MGLLKISHLTGLLILLGAITNIVDAARSWRSKRQTYHYDESLKQYARPHAGTKIITGTVGRYAPNEWPAWYSRTIMKWDGISRISPYDQNDSRFGIYIRKRFQNA